MIIPNPVYLFRIVHWQNIEYILRHGLCSNNHVLKDPQYINIGHPQLIADRHEYPIPLVGYGNLGEYIPFYFWGHSPMLYLIMHGFKGVTQFPQEDIVYLVIDSKQIIEADFQYVFTDRHAKVKLAKFMENCIIDMIYFLQGDLLQCSAQALVNTVNTVGVMGKGIALQFKQRFPYNYKVYKEACKNGTLQVGEMLVVKEPDLVGERYIINFPTKAHWKSPSKIEYIENGLQALKGSLQEYHIESVALPPLGCGNGGLDWNMVKPMITEALEGLDIDIYVYEPNSEIKSLLQAEDGKKKEQKLTPAKAMLLYLMFHYESVGDISSLFAANKLAYFLQESGENLRLRFTAHHYGPYAVQLNHVLYSLNGAYLQGLEQNQAKAFEPLRLNYERYDEVERFVKTQLNPTQLDRVESVLGLIRGFESTYALELLASVDYAAKQPGVASVEDIQKHIQQWNQRKANLFKPEHIALASQHLDDYRTALV